MLLHLAFTDKNLSIYLQILNYHIIYLFGYFVFFPWSIYFYLNIIHNFLITFPFILLCTSQTRYSIFYLSKYLSIYLTSFFINTNMNLLMYLGSGTRGLNRQRLRILFRDEESTDLPQDADSEAQTELPTGPRSRVRSRYYTIYFLLYNSMLQSRNGGTLGSVLHYSP